jgi:hypothetical protein
MLILFALSIVVVLLAGPVLAEGRAELQPLKRTWVPPTVIGVPDFGDDEGDDEGNEGLGFGKKIAGAWLGEGQFALDLFCDGVPDADPTFFDYDSHSFTVGGLWIATNPNNPNLGHGTWVQTGPREITADSIVYATDPATGALVWVMRIPGVFTFDEGFKTATSTFGAVGYLPGEDPLDPTIVPQWCTLGEHFQLRKVEPAP